MRRISMTTLAAILMMVGGACARGPLSTDGGSASPGWAPPGVAGHWRGTLTETGGWYYLGRIPLDLRIAEDGTWKGTIGTARAAGRASVRGDDVILAGTAIAPGDKEDPVYFRLTGDDARRWGTTLATFPGREPAHAEVSLTKESSA
jgi:hypothetical protein